MRRTLIALALVGCTKEPPASQERAAAKIPASESQETTPRRSAKLPIARTVPRVQSQPLPPEANPPGVPALSGPLQVDRDVQYIDEVVGTGPAPTKGQRIEVHYTGWLTDGTKFDSSRDRGEPIVFTFDGGQVIKGWDIGLTSMRVGGKRRIILPAELAYGERGAGDAIPPDAMLVFDVELVAVKE